MVYDAGIMRSILALALAALVLAANAPGLFTETPVCAAVDGAPAVATKTRAQHAVPAGSFMKWHRKKRPASPSCCGTASCPMHAHGCGQTAACTMDAAYGPDPMIASAPKHSPSDTRLCAPSCGRGGARVVPDLPDPGTLDLHGRPAPQLAGSEGIHHKPPSTPSRSSAPVVPPPRS